MNGKYDRTLLLPSALDTSSQIILLTFALVPAETKERCAWFLGFIIGAFHEGRDDLGQSGKLNFQGNQCHYRQHIDVLSRGSQMSVL